MGLPRSLSFETYLFFIYSEQPMTKLNRMSGESDPNYFGPKVALCNTNILFSIIKK